MRELYSQAAGAWAALHFGGVTLNDPRRGRRLATLARGYAENPGASVPRLFCKVSEVKAAYTFFDRPEVTPAALQAGHRALVAEQLRKPGTFLLIEDSSEFSWPAVPAREGLGTMRRQRQGFVLHTSLAAVWEKPGEAVRRGALRVLGLAHQEFYPRTARPAGEADKATQARRQRARESELWQRSTQALGPAPREAHVRWVRVADRGADIEFFLHACLAQRHGFVVRAAQNRRLVVSEDRPPKLFAAARAAPALGDFALSLRARPGQAARTAKLSLSATRVTLRPTPQPGGQARQRPPLTCTVVRAWEAQPAGQALEWLLLSDAPVASFEAAREVTQQYASRWLIEEFHKCLKTGLGAEALQLQTAPRLFNAVALLAVVAIRLLALKEAVHLDAALPAHVSGLSAAHLHLLGRATGRELSTVRDVALALGRLGGHMNRPSDGLPGWQSLWAGRRKLLVLLEGAALARSSGTFGV